MRAITWFVAGATALTAVAGAGFLLAGAPNAEGQQPDPVQAARDHLTGFHTWYVANKVGIFRVDAHQEFFVADVQSTGSQSTVQRQADGTLLQTGRDRPPTSGRLSWDGTTLHWASVSTIIDLPQMYADRVHEVWNELRTGFPNVTLSPGDPRDIDPTWVMSSENRQWFRVETPFTWDDHVVIFASFQVTGELSRISAFDTETQEPIEVLGHAFEDVRFSMPAITDVPLDPDIGSPEQPTPWNRHRNFGSHHGQHGESTFTSDQMPMYHDAIRQVRLEIDPAVSTDLLPGDALQVSQQCDFGPAFAYEGLDVQWAPPDDPDTTSRLAAAQGSCTGVTFSMGLRGSAWATGSGVHSCYDGLWQVVNRETSPVTVLWERTLEGCADHDNDRVDPMEISWTVPPTADLSQLGVRFTGSIEAECTEGNDGHAGASLFFGRIAGHRSPTIHMQPKMSWDCFPGWSP